MLKKISAFFQEIHRHLNNLLVLCLNLVSNYLDRFRDESTRLNRQIDSFTIEFHALIPKDSAWDQVREDIGTALITYLPALRDRQQALGDSLHRVKNRLIGLQTGQTSDSAIKNITFALENKKILEQKLKETSEQIRYTVEYLNNLEVLVIASQNQARPPQGLLDRSADFVLNIQLTGLEDTGIKDDITTEINGFKIEK